jgi:hypothetical protein
VRSVRLSAASKPVIEQVASRAATHEGGMLPAVVRELDATSAALMEIDSLEAGGCAHAHARLLAEAHQGEMMGRKGKQPARSRAWEPYHGAQRRSHLQRTTEMAASLAWSPRNQGWSVEKDMGHSKSGQVAHAQRDDVTHRHRGRLKPASIRSVVRWPWAIANHGHWTVEVIRDEESQVWCGQGIGIQVLGLVRARADTLVARLRCRYWRQPEPRRAEKRRWQAWWDGLCLLICHVGSTLFPHRQATAGR